MAIPPIQIKNITCCIDTKETNTTPFSWKIDFSGTNIDVNKTYKLTNCQFLMIIPKDSIQVILPQLYVVFFSGVNNPSDASIFSTMKGENTSTISAQISSQISTVVLYLENYYEIPIPGDTVYSYFIYNTKQVYEFTSTATTWIGHIDTIDYRLITNDPYDLQYYEVMNSTQFPYKKRLWVPLFQKGSSKKLANNLILSMTVQV